MVTFLKAHNLLEETIPLGFTFSFPLHQHGLAKACLVTWTKGFKASGVVGEDVVRLLNEATKRKVAIN